MFIKIDQRAAIIIGLVAIIAVWAYISPDSFSSTIDSVKGAIDGAIEGAG